MAHTLFEFTATKSGVGVELPMWKVVPMRFTVAMVMAMGISISIADVLDTMVRIIATVSHMKIVRLMVFIVRLVRFMRLVMVVFMVRFVLVVSMVRDMVVLLVSIGIVRMDLVNVVIIHMMSTTKAMSSTSNGRTESSVISSVMMFRRSTVVEVLRKSHRKSSAKGVLHSFQWFKLSEGMRFVLRDVMSGARTETLVAKVLMHRRKRFRVEGFVMR